MTEPWRSGRNTDRVPAATFIWFSTSLGPSAYAYQRRMAPVLPSYSSTSRLSVSVTEIVVVAL